MFDIMTMLRNAIVLTLCYESLNTSEQFSRISRKRLIYHAGNLQNTKVLSEEKLKAWKFNLNGWMIWSGSIGAIQILKEKVFTRKPPSRSHLFKLELNNSSLVCNYENWTISIKKCNLILHQNFDQCTVFVLFYFSH